MVSVPCSKSKVPKPVVQHSLLWSGPLQVGLPSNQRLPLTIYFFTFLGAGGYLLHSHDDSTRNLYLFSSHPVPSFIHFVPVPPLTGLTDNSPLRVLSLLTLLTFLREHKGTRTHSKQLPWKEVKRDADCWSESDGELRLAAVGCWRECSRSCLQSMTHKSRSGTGEVFGDILCALNEGFCGWSRKTR